MTPSRPRARTLPVLMLSAIAAAVTPTLAPSPAVAEDLPSGAPAPSGGDGRTLDQWLANVCGETVTRRMLVREIGPQEPDEPEVAYERRLRDRLVMRTINGVMAWKAKLFGLDPRPSVVDEIVQKEADEAVKAARERDPGITFEGLLRKRGQSLDEFKAILARELVVQNYRAILFNGTPGKRAQIDVEPAPAECRRLYDNHRASFDQAAGVRVATFAASPETYLEASGDRYDVAVESARKKVESLAAQVASGRTPADVAKANKLEQGSWSASAADAWVEKGRGGTSLEEVDAWAFDPARRVGETKVVDGPRGMVIAYVILAVRPSRTKSYDEALPDVMNRIRSTRQRRFWMHHMLEVMASAPVKPPMLVEEISDQLRTQLQRLDEDPIDREIRLR
ncbi:MAG: peptidylprolyl isomerase [Planctomycetota bacterium]